MKRTGLLKHLTDLRAVIADALCDANTYQNVTAKNYLFKLHEPIELLSKINKDLSVIESMGADGAVDLGSMIDSKIDKFMERLPDLYKQVMTAMDDIRDKTESEHELDEDLPPTTQYFSSRQDRYDNELARRHNVEQSAPYQVLLSKRDELIDELCICEDANRIIAITQQLQPVAHAMQFMMVADISLYAPIDKDVPDLTGN
jgi:hypothetical protein